jgi:hypothetical protein
VVYATMREADAEASSPATRRKASSVKGVEGLVTLVVVLTILTITNRARRATAAMDLPRGQRLRPVGLLLLEPVLYVLLVGALLWDEVSESSAHVLAGLGGLAVGVAVGLYRARIMYVRADPVRRAVVLTRSTAEYVALAVLGLLELGRSDLEHRADRLDSPLSLLVTALVALALSEALARIGAIVLRYRRSVGTQAATTV